MNFQKSIIIFFVINIGILPIVFCKSHANVWSRNTFQWDSFKKRDFDGDKQDEILLVSEKSTGILKLVPCSVPKGGNGTLPSSKRTGGAGAKWKFAVLYADTSQKLSTWNAMRENVGPTGDFDGDGKTEMFLHRTYYYSLIGIDGTGIVEEANLHSGTSIGPHAFAPSNTLFGPVGDFDGDGKDEIMVVTQIQMINLLKFDGKNFAITAEAGYEIRFSGWHLDSDMDCFGPVGDFDGDGKMDILVLSEWGMVALKVNNNKIVPMAGVCNGTRIGDLLFDARFDRIGPVADFNGDGKAELLVTGPSGIGVLKMDGDTFVRITNAPDGADLGQWIFNNTENCLGPTGDFDGDGKAETVIKSLRSLGILKLSGNRLTVSVKARDGERLGDWPFNVREDKIGPAGDFDGDKKDELVVSSNWGTGILKPTANSFTTLASSANGTLYGRWPLFTYNYRYCQSEFVPYPDRIGSHPAESFAVHDPKVLYGIYRNNLIRSHMSHPGMVEARSGKPWPYIQKFPLNRNLEKFNDNVDRKEPGLAPDSCLLRMKSLSKCGNRQPDFTWIGSDDTYMLSGVALALFSMEAMDLGTISSIGYAQNIFHALQFSRIQLNYDMIVKKETLISADELISICIGLLNYHRMCVKYNFTMERAEVEKFTSLIAASLGRHGYWVLPDFSSLNDVTRFTSAMVSKKNWWAHQCALLYAYPLQLIFKEITGTKTCIAWDSTEYDLYVNGKVNDKVLFPDSTDRAAFIKAAVAVRDGAMSLSTHATVIVPPNSGDSCGTMLKTLGVNNLGLSPDELRLGTGRHVSLAVDSPFVFDALCAILKRNTPKQNDKTTPGAFKEKTISHLGSDRMSLSEFKEGVAENIQNIISALGKAGGHANMYDYFKGDYLYLLTALSATVILENNGHCTSTIGDLFEALIHAGYNNSLFAVIAEKCAKDGGGKKSDEMGNKGSSEIVEVDTGRTTKCQVADTAIFDNLLTGTSEKWITRRMMITNSLDGDTGWVAILKSEFADDTAAYRIFAGEKAEQTALKIMKEYATGAGVNYHR